MPVASVCVRACVRGGGTYHNNIIVGIALSRPCMYNICHVPGGSTVSCYMQHMTYIGTN